MNAKLPQVFFKGSLILALLVLSAGCGDDSNKGSRGCLATGACPGDGTGKDVQIVVPRVTESEAGGTPGSSTTGSGSVNNPVLGTNTTGFTCTATPYPAVANPGETVRLEIQTQGRTGKNFIPGPAGQAPYVSEFSDYVNLFGSYNNDGITAKVVERSVYVVEQGTNIYTSCPFRVTVRGNRPSNNPLRCSVAIAERRVLTGGDANFTFTAYNVVRRATFSSFWISTLRSIADSSLVRVNDFQTSARVKYDIPGPKTASVKVRDESGAEASCNIDLNVDNASNIQITAFPAASVAVGNAIQLVAQVRGVVSPEQFTIAFQSSDPDAQITVGGNRATIRSRRTDAHSFTVTASATSTTQRIEVPAQDQIVSFVSASEVPASSTLQCNLVSGRAADNLDFASSVSETAVVEARPRGGQAPYTLERVTAERQTDSGFASDSAVAVDDASLSSQQKRIRAAAPGLYRLTGYIRSGDGQTAQCTSFHNVTP